MAFFGLDLRASTKLMGAAGSVEMSGSGTAGFIGLEGSKMDSLADSDPASSMLGRRDRLLDVSLVSNLRRLVGFSLGGLESISIKFWSSIEMTLPMIASISS